jgi:hypothetical protein
MIDSYLYAMSLNKTARTFSDGTESLQYKFQFSDKADKSILFNESRYEKEFEYMLKKGARVWNEADRSFVNRLNGSFAYLSAARIACPEMGDKFDLIECQVMMRNKDIIMAAFESSGHGDQLDQQMAQELLDAVISRCEDQEIMSKFTELREPMADLANTIKEKIVEYAAELGGNEIEDRDVAIERE